jgi:anti-anti-sigma factor
MKIIVQRRNGCWILRPVGPFACGRGQGELRASVEEVLAKGGLRLVLDLSGVAYTDAAGIGQILHCEDRVRASGGRLVVAAACPKVREVLQMTRVAERVPVARGVPAAIRNLRPADRRAARSRAWSGPGEAQRVAS